MRISELIEKFDQIKSRYGDLPVYVLRTPGPTIAEIKGYDLFVKLENEDLPDRVEIK